MQKDNSLFLLALNRIEWLRTKEKLFFVELFADLERFFLLSKQDLEAAIGRRIKEQKYELTACLKAAEKDWKFLNSNPAHGFLFFWDEAYPAALREIYDPPFLLFYRGKLPTFQYPMVAIVGTRQPTGQARSAAFQLATELSDAGISVVSGLARGVDAEAHTGSLLGTGTAVAVLGNGIDAVYPVSNRQLGQNILASGGVIFSEYAPGTPPLKYNFPKRNRIISGMSRAVVVIQAPESSGALITADYGLNQGRDIYVHKAGLSGEQGAGTLKLANEGAYVIENSRQMLYDWGWMEKTCTTQVKAPGNGTRLVSPGTILAQGLRLELEDRYTMYNGDFFRRFADG